jgi:hypothetical protein
MYGSFSLTVKCRLIPPGRVKIRLIRVKEKLNPDKEIALKYKFAA